MNQMAQFKAATRVDCEVIAQHLGETKARDYGYTFSDITQRFIPSLVLPAYPKDSITRHLALAVIDEMEPTPPFKTE